MYSHEIKPHLKKILEKLSKKDKHTYEQILKKIDEIIKSDSIEHYKNLRHDEKEFKRVHIDKSFVLLFKVLKEKNFILFDRFDHHDNIYKRK